MGSADETVVRSFDEFRLNGLLWLINASVFHPRGYAVGFSYDDEGNVDGWVLLGQGDEPWRFDGSADGMLNKVSAFFEQAREQSLYAKVVGLPGFKPKGESGLALSGRGEAALWIAANPETVAEMQRKLTVDMIGAMIRLPVDTG